MGSTTPASVEPPLIPSLPNLRDVGGRPASGGAMVRSGLLYRSTDLSRLDHAAAPAFERLGIGAVYDLRTDEERAMQPDRLPAGTDLIVVDVLADSTDASPAALMAIMDDPPAASRELGGSRAAGMFEQKYREFVRLGSARRAYGRLFADIAAPARRPALVHCTTGKDRTGWAVAALLLLLGVAEDEVEREYLRSNELLAPFIRSWIDGFAARGGDPEAILPLLLVRPSYLAAALDEMCRGYGSLEGYFADGLCIDATVQARLRTTFLERP